jgi:hypothetical protein
MGAMQRWTWSVILGASCLLVAGEVRAGECDTPSPEWLMCEDFESGGLGWEAWFAQSPFIECNGCVDGVNNPDRIALLEDASAGARRGLVAAPARGCGRQLSGCVADLSHL